MTWLAVVLAASLTVSSVASGDGQPPVTLIEIPVPTTTVTSAGVTDVAPATTSVPNTTVTPTTIISEDTDQVGVQWPIGATVTLLVLALLVTVLVLVRRRRQQLADTIPMPLRLPAPPPPMATPAPMAPPPPMATPAPMAPPPPVPPEASRRFEAIEYRGVSKSSAVEPRTLGEFTTVEAAIDTARRARSLFDAEDEAFWVVWNLGLKRAAWVAESGTPGESVIDLRTGRREPYLVAQADAARDS